MEVRTRFAPSPTGYLHIGGVRTALFNWFLARRHNGQFILRIDNTDADRHVEESVELIIKGFKWLGVNWDEGPYFQSQRSSIYEKAIINLIKAGFAYPCDVTTVNDKKTKKPPIIRGALRNLPPDECLAIYHNKKPALRFKVPLGLTTINDHIRGKVEFQNDLLSDFVIAREGGTPLYNLASIIDDLDMKITHIIRAEEHLANTHPQILIAQALGATTPEFAHIPFVASPGTKTKLSKRNPPPGVMVALDEYEKAGYLPEALINALAKLGWSLDDKSEIIDLSTIIDNFSLDRITSAPASLDANKIFWTQGEYMRLLPQATRIKLMMPFLHRAKLINDPPTVDEYKTIEKIDTASGCRLKLLKDIVNHDFFFKDKLDYEVKAAKCLTQAIIDDLRKIVDAIRAVEEFTASNIEIAIHLIVDRKFNRNLRAAVTGKSVGIGLYDCIEIIGKDKACRNIESTIAAIMNNQFGGNNG